MKYTIFKNFHYSLIRIPQFWIKKRIYNWTVKFDSNTSYNLGNDNQYDWNKLIGIQESFFTPHKNSVRIGWRFNLETNKQELSAYWYSNSERFFEKIYDIELEKEFLVTFIFKDNTAVIKIDNQVVKEISYTLKSKITGKLFPYFGGDQTSPKKMTIKID